MKLADLVATPALGGMDIIVESHECGSGAAGSRRGGSSGHVDYRPSSLCDPMRTSCSVSLSGLR